MRMVQPKASSVQEEPPRQSCLTKLGLKVILSPTTYYHQGGTMGHTANPGATLSLSAADKRRAGRPISNSKPATKRTKPEAKSFLSNLRLARTLWGSLSKIVVKALHELTRQYGFSVAAGDLLLLENRWYVTHAGLLGLGQRRKCCGIHTTLQKGLSDPSSSRWIFKATVYKSHESRGFVGYGDADPSNVSLMVHGAELRIAETRAVNRALRKAYGIGLCLVEELG